MSAIIISLPVEKRGPPQPVDEKDPWVSVAFVCIGIASAESTKAQQPLLHALLCSKFADVPDVVPSPDDTSAFARYAVKQLLKALTADSEGHQLAAEAADAVFAAMIASDD